MSEVLLYGTDGFQNRKSFPHRPQNPVCSGKACRSATTWLTA